MVGPERCIATYYNTNSIVKCDLVNNTTETETLPSQYATRDIHYNAEMDRLFLVDTNSKLYSGVIGQLSGT